MAEIEEYNNIAFCRNKKGIQVHATLQINGQKHCLGRKYCKTKSEIQNTIELVMKIAKPKLKELKKQGKKIPPNAFKKKKKKLILKKAPKYILIREHKKNAINFGYKFGHKGNTFNGKCCTTIKDAQRECYAKMKEVGYEKGIKYFANFLSDNAQMPPTSGKKRKGKLKKNSSPKKRRIESTKDYTKFQEIHRHYDTFGEDKNESFIVHENLMIDEVPRALHEETIDQCLNDHHLKLDMNMQCNKNNLDRMTVFVPKMKNENGEWSGDGGIMILGCYIGDKTEKYMILARQEVGPSYRRRCVNATECHWMGALCMSQGKILRIKTASKSCVSMLEKYKTNFQKKKTYQKEDKFQEEPESYFKQKFYFDYIGKPLPKSVVGTKKMKDTQARELTKMIGKTGMIFPNRTNINGNW